MKSQNWPDGEPLSPVDLVFASIIAGMIVEVAVDAVIRSNLEKCVDALGQPVSLKDFCAGVLVDEGLPPEMRLAIIEDAVANNSVGWWFVRKSPSFDGYPIRKQLVTVLAIDEEKKLAYVCPVSRFFVGDTRYFIVQFSDLMNVIPQ